MLSAFVIFVLISSFTMLNMLIGILCEVVQATGEGERNKNTEAHVRESITTLFNKIDKDKNGEITREEFLSMKRDKNVMKALQELDVKAKHFEMYADLMFNPQEEGGEIPTFDFEKTINMIMRLRPGTKVSALDFASFQMTVYKNHDRLRKHITNIEKMTTVLTGTDLGAGSSPPSREDPNMTELAAEPSNRISMSMLPQLQKSSEQEILIELQRRLGVPVNVPGDAQMKSAPTKTTIDPGEENTIIHSSFQAQLPGLPDIQAWSKETYTC